MTFDWQVAVPDAEDVSEAYDSILGYLDTLDNPEDIMNNILMFYEVINQPLTNYSSPQDDYHSQYVTHPLSNPYNATIPAYVSSTSVVAQLQTRQEATA